METVDGCTAGGIPIRFPRNFGRYSYVRTLSSGSSCVCIEAENCATRDRYACKVVSRVVLTEAGEFGYFEQELRVHQFLNHQNIVKVHDVIFQPDLVFVIMDLCERDLLAFIVEHPGAYPSVYRPIVVQVLRALDYLHKRGIAHRDIKPDNVLLTSTNQAKLADFGCCEVTTFGGEPKASGTVFYAAPEIFVNPTAVGMKADIWSFGVLLFTMFSGHLPWQDGEKEMLIDQIVNRRFSTAFVMPRDVKSLFDKCTAFDPANRPTAAELLEDPWLLNAPVEKPQLISSHGSASFSQITGFTHDVAVRRSSVASPPQNGRKRMSVRVTSAQSMSIRAAASHAGADGFHFGPNNEV
jgi:serine/threonine protein kinase